MAQVPPTPWLTVRAQPAGSSLSPDRRAWSPSSHKIARPPVRLSAAFNKALRSPHVMVTGTGGLSVVGAPPGCGVGSCVAVGACAMHPPATNPQTSPARQTPDRTVLMEPPLWRIGAARQFASTRAAKTLPEQPCARPLTAMTGAGPGGTTLGRSSAADLLQVQRRTIPDTIFDCGWCSPWTVALPPTSCPSVGRRASVPLAPQPLAEHFAIAAPLFGFFAPPPLRGFLVTAAQLH